MAMKMRSCRKLFAHNLSARLPLPVSILILPALQFRSAEIPPGCSVCPMSSGLLRVSLSLGRTGQGWAQTWQGEGVCAQAWAPKF